MALFDGPTRVTLSTGGEESNVRETQPRDLCIVYRLARNITKPLSLDYM